MGVSAGKFNKFTFFKLPAAWWTGVRVKAIDHQKCVVTVKHGWRNQNPFKSAAQLFSSFGGHSDPL